MLKIRSAALFVAGICIALTSATTRADDAPDVKMTLLPSGATVKLGGYRPQRLSLSTEKPASLKKAPELSAPLYGELKFGGASYLIAVDEPEGKPAALYVDANGNGDLTDDPAVSWEKNVSKGRKGVELIGHNGSFKLPLKTGDTPTLVTLKAYRFDKNDPTRAPLKTTLLYFSDYAYEGDITLAGSRYKAMFCDDLAKGDFRGDKDAAFSGVSLRIDLNGDGKFDFRSEVFDGNKPFNVKGTTWELADLTAAGSFKIVKSAQTVAEVAPPADHTPGKKATAFKAKKMDGSDVAFPGDYKGKIVMLDFWATWCGPCMGEVPGLVKAYNEFHPKGIEILGITLDKADSAEKVKSVTAAKGMTWSQVYDGKYWKAEIAQLYGIESIPAAFLVDGDTGEILAAGQSLRGANLVKTLEKALAEKAEKTKKAVH